ncbi:MAG: GAF domain-containing protein, partial [Anaerolineae bacterium]|nr:GAF domain-containing protein [Anaerolineae bacterium]
MTSHQTLSRLSWALFAMRWLLVGGVALLAVLLPVLEPTTGEAVQEPLLLAALIGVPIALSGLLTTSAARGRTGPGLAGLLLDIGYALVVFWASGGQPVVLVAVGTLPALIGALRLGGRYGLAAAVLLAVAAPLFFVSVIAPVPADPLLAPLPDPLPGILLAAGALVMIGVFVSVPTLVASLGWSGQQTLMHERDVESTRLRTAREQARAIYEMASTLSATLNYQQVLDAALDLGVLGLREMGPNVRLVSTVLLFDKDSGYLKVANARRLTRADVEKRVPGKRGVLGLALKGAEPVFANDAHRDPELKYFVAFQDARSILAVPLRAGFDSFGVLLFGSTMPDAFSDEHVDQLSAIASQATIALQNAMLYENLLEEKERIIEVEEDARRQLSRDLHDGPTQSVAAIAMRVNYIRRLLEREPGQVPVELQKVEELA